MSAANSRLGRRLRTTSQNVAERPILADATELKCRMVGHLPILDFGFPIFDRNRAFLNPKSAIQNPK